MRLYLLPAMAVGLFAVAAGAGQGQDEVRAILDKAIKAQGGEEFLIKYKAGVIKTKAHVEVAGGLDITQEISYQLPDKFRDEQSFDVNGTAVKIVTVFNGTKAAIEVNGKKLPDDEKLLEAIKDGVNAMQVLNLVPLKGKDFELTAVGEAQVNGKPAVGIRASKKGQRDMTAYFDKATYLLVKVEQRTVDPMGGQEIDQERIITEFATVDGRPQPKKIVINRDGKKFLEGEALEVKHFERLDDGMFTLP
jgi:hypothetical protein